MGIDKSRLVFRGKTFLEQVITQVSQICAPVVVVGDIDFSLHALPPNVLLDCDKDPNKGPLEGIRVGLERLSSQVEFAFVTSCDVPLLHPDLVRYLYGKIEGANAVVPVDGDRVFGMTAIYRTELHTEIGKRIAANQLRVSELANALNAIQTGMEAIRLIDPDLDSMTNINSKGDYIRLLDRFNLKCPAEIAAAIGLGQDGLEKSS